MQIPSLPKRVQSERKPHEQRGAYLHLTQTCHKWRNTTPERFCVVPYIFERVDITKKLTAFCWLFCRCPYLCIPVSRTADNRSPFPICIMHYIFAYILSFQMYLFFFLNVAFYLGTTFWTKDCSIYFISRKLYYLSVWNFADFRLLKLFISNMLKTFLRGLESPVFYWLYTLGIKFNPLTFSWIKLTSKIDV